MRYGTKLGQGAVIWMQMTHETFSRTKGLPLQTLMAVQMLQFLHVSSLLNRMLVGFPVIFAKRAKSRVTTKHVGSFFQEALKAQSFAKDLQKVWLTGC